MVDPIGKWLLVRYARLWNSFTGKEFDFQEAIKILDEDSKRVGVVLNQLYEKEWVDRKTNPKDRRKRFYKLKNPENVIKELGCL